MYLPTPQSSNRPAWRSAGTTSKLVIAAALLLGMLFSQGCPTASDAEHIARKAEELLFTGDFEELERLASIYRAPAMSGGEKRLDLAYFYEGLSGYRGFGRYGWYSRHPVDEKMRALRAWMQTAPNSTAARIASSQLFTQRALTSSGRSLSSDLASASSGGLGDLVRSAISIAYDRNGPGLFGEGDPHALRVLIDLARVRGEPELMVNTYRRAVASYPGYPGYDEPIADALRSQWGGEKLRFGRLIRSMLQGEDADGSLVRALSDYLFRGGISGEALVAGTGVEWTQVEQALKESGDQWMRSFTELKSDFPGYLNSARASLKSAWNMLRAGS